MKFIINTSLDPHFCAIFSEENKLIEKKAWTNRSQDGHNIYEFLANYDTDEISLCGAVSGPGGFASLRASACVITSISFANRIDLHQISAEKLMNLVLGSDEFLLNSFGNSVWKVLDGTIKRVSLDDIDKDSAYFVDVLPQAKAAAFTKKIKHSLEGIESVLLQGLIDSPERKVFIPHYEFPPV